MRLVLKNVCICGILKQVTSKLCLKCFRKSITKSKIWTCVCGKKKFSKSKTCRECYKKQKSLNALSKTIGHFWKINRGGPNAYVHIRGQARDLMKTSGIPKQCKNCKYNKHVEVCHIKGINEFHKKTKLKTVNALSNMLYLCPNCHWEFDKGILTLEEIKSKV